MNITQTPQPPCTQQTTLTSAATASQSSRLNPTIGDVPTTPLDSRHTSCENSEDESEDENVKHNLVIRYTEQHPLGRGYCYASTDDAQNYALDTQHLTALAEQGNADAQTQLGMMYYHGYGVDQDYDQAFIWFKEAAKQGYADAQNQLGMMYYHGQGVDQDYDQAFTCFKEAAKQGNADAQNQLGMMYYKGQGVDQDYGQAFICFEKAAYQGNADAQNQLGVMYAKGKGTLDKDNVKAYMYFEFANIKNHEQAQKKLARIKLSVEQISQLKDLIQEWSDTQKALYPVSKDSLAL